MLAAMGGEAADGGKLRNSTRRAVGSVKDRVEALAGPVPGHELADIRFHRRTTMGSRPARALLTVVAVLAVVVGGWMLIRDIGGGDSGDPAVAVAGLSPTGVQLPAAGADSTSSEQAPEVGEVQGASGSPGSPGQQEGKEVAVVAVQGLVDAPGLRTVDAGTRVGEVLDLVGGVRAEASLEGINLAEKVVDGMQIVVDPGGSRVSYPGGGPVGGTGGAAPAGAAAGVAGQAAAPAPGAAGAGTAGAGKVNINTADAAGLTALPGVGEKTARSIVAWRQDNGPFTSPEQLMEVKGIGPAKFEAMKEMVGV